MAGTSVRSTEVRDRTLAAALEQLHHGDRTPAAALEQLHHGMLLLVSGFSRVPHASGQIPIVINAAANGVVPCTVINLTSL
jgi:hypothetical protein